MRPASLFRFAFSLFLSAILCTRADAQTTGSIVGRVVDAASGAALVNVDLSLDKLPHRTVSGADGRFVIGGVPAGERDVRAQHIGYQPLVLTRVQVRPGRATEIRIALDVSPVQVAPLEVRADRQRLVEPEVSTTHQAVVGRELRELPVDRIEDVLELTTGVTDGHFRGGRVGQEVYVVDGIELKNQLEASRQGAGLELSPSSLEEVDVITGGFGAEYGSALSGVVSYTTRRGNPDRWESRASYTTDQWAPATIFRGFSGLSLSTGGPLGFLGRGATLYADVLAQGMLDADSRSRGLTCVQPEDAAPDLAAAIRSLQSDAGTRAQYCPYSSSIIPHQRGDKLIGFARFDKPLSNTWNLSASLLRNRNQRELYTSEFKYNNDYQLGQRGFGTLANISAERLVQKPTGSTSFSARAALVRLDRYLGVVDPATWDQLAVGGFRPSAFRFIGEDFTRSHIDEQLTSFSAVPGYIAPTSTGAPFGPAGAGLFYTAGTPRIANWSRSDLLSGDVSAASFTPDGSTYRAGVNAKLYRVENYERALADLAASPNYARFYPATFSTFGEANIQTDDGMHFEFGVRAEAFRSGIDFQLDRGNILSPVISSSWKINVMPRLGVAFPIPGSSGRSAIRFNFGRVSQPPDFRYFLDSTIGDSLRTDIRRQGNPNIAFERGSSYEVGATHLFNEHVSAAFTAFRKTLEHVASGNLMLGDVGQAGQFSTNDFGTVKGVELTLRARWTGALLRLGWAMQRATGMTTGAENDSTITTDAARNEYPLAFDRRHAGDLSLFLGRAAGSSAPWSAALTATAQSGYPLFQPIEGNALGREAKRYLPWTTNIDLRASLNVGTVPVCAHCAWRVVFDGRNIIDRKNIVALRSTTATITPSLAEVQKVANSIALPNQPIPRESPFYSAAVDSNHDGVISPAEASTARFAAALDRYDPTLYFGEGRQLRLGIEVTF